MADLYQRSGLDFVEGMNATASLAVHQRESRRLTIVTDRLGTHPVHYASVDDGLIFSTSIQSVVRHPAVDATPDTDGVRTYLAFNRVPGVETPFEGVRTIPPGSVATIDLATGELSLKQYWRLEYDPLDRSFSYFVDRFVELLQQVFGERAGDDREYGLLLSGGNDSRLLLAASEISATYHLSDWMSREARTAERVALRENVDFRLFSRPDDHHERMLAHAPRHMNFNGRFDQAHLHEFDARIRDDVDVLVTGLYGDSFFKGGGLVPSPMLDLGHIGSITLPTMVEPDSVEAFVGSLEGSLPPYADAPRGIESVVQSNLEERSDGSVSFYGVTYPSLTDLVLSHSYYPLSNDGDYHYFGLTQMVLNWTPFLDNRFVDLAYSMPIEYHLRRDIVSAALSELSTELAAISHAETNVRATDSVYYNQLRKYGHLFYRKHIRDRRPPKPYYSEGSWRDRGVSLRERDFGWDLLKRNDEALRSMPFLDREAAYSCYRSHMAGEDHTAELYTLFTILRMPAFREVRRGTERLTGIEFGPG